MNKEAHGREQRGDCSGVPMGRFGVYDVPVIGQPLRLIIVCQQHRWRTSHIDTPNTSGLALGEAARVVGHGCY